ncbi:MAG: hypothetical protein EXX96DRAFT_619699 [Benjaminiella poitrasii]|nr:MAG: hypothetical protein EXX96DRAFT_619699 [Benjaminiella poitrasii]
MKRGSWSLLPQFRPRLRQLTHFRFCHAQITLLFSSNCSCCDLKDGHGNITNEQGIEAMDLQDYIDPYNIVTHQYEQLEETANNFDQEMEDLVEEVHMKDVAKGTYNNYSDKQKAVFYYFHKIKLLKAAPSARKAEDPAWDIYEKQTNKINRAPSQLKEEHKRHLVQFFDERPQATRQDAVDSLMEVWYLSILELNIKR